MNIFDYIKTYGKYSFKERKFNEIDNVIFSCLSYVDFTNIVSENFDNKITLNEAANIYFKTNSNKKIKQNKMPAIKTGIKTLKAIMKTKRYKDILVYNYQYASDELSQFGALTFDIDNKTSYISFEGTDHLISGWREDCIIMYKFPVTAQSLAISYLNKFLYVPKKLIIGGHSKGGHLAIISSMYTNIFIKSKIIKIYSNDGLGLKKEQFASRKYKSIKKKVIKLIPDYSIVGHLLYSDTNYKIIKSSKKSFFAHNPNYWIVKDTKFVRSKNSKMCKVLEKALYKWLDKYELATRIKFADTLFNVCNELEIESLYDLKGKKRILLKKVLDSKNIDIDVKDAFKELYRNIILCNKEYKNGVVE